MCCFGCGRNNNDLEKDSETNNVLQKETASEATSENMEDYFKDTNIVENYNPNLTCYLQNMIITMSDDIMYSIISDNTSGGKYIYAADLKTGIQMPLCSKSDCNHNNDKCNAYIGDEKIDIFNISNIDNVIYIFGEKTSSDCFLMRISADGSIREDLGTVLTIYGNDTIQESLIHRGFLYYALGETNSALGGNDIGESVEGKIYRYSIDGSSSPECIYEFSELEKQGENKQLSFMLEAQGESLYVRQMVVTQIDMDMDIEYEEYKINTTSLEKEIIDTEINYCKQTERDTLLYVNRYNTSGDIASIEMDMQLEYEEQCRMQKIRFYNNSTNEIKENSDIYIKDNEMFDIGNFWVTDKYICFNADEINGGIVATYIFDFNFNLIKKLDDIDGIDYCFGEYILWHKSSDDGRKYYISNIEDCISGDKNYGEMFLEKEKSTGTVIEINQYIYEK